MPEVMVNGAFSGQRITGQQRYATEMTRALRDLAPDRYQVVPPPAGSTRARDWAWVQTGLPRRARGRVLLSFTSRVPAIHACHVVTVHDLFPLTNPEWYSRKYLALHRPLLRRALRSARGVVVVSEPVLQQIRERGLAPPSTPIVVAPNAPSVLPRGGDEVSDDVARVLGGSAYWLSVGSDDPRKNVSTVLAAYAQLSPGERSATPLVLVGGGSGAVFAGATRVSLPTGVVDLGYVSDGELHELYRGARGLVSASLDEGFGLPLVEAADAGCPLVVSDIDVYRWVLGGRARYFAATDASALAAELRRPAADLPDPAAPLPRVYSWAESARTVDDLVSSVLAR